MCRASFEYEQLAAATMVALDLHGIRVSFRSLSVIQQQISLIIHFFNQFENNNGAFDN